ncbi:WD-repeat protein [Scytonema sp. HK-05]|uniref:NB-ARC domain-containing protein n=1 Tax=Scytonema sp. HK-05 TaxID=1137095 RepID=UPI0009379FC0|nr:NB-ARC domain-containing protein [Scytonema sp. HK-05]OKH58811.1 hypothetical protein NIES2130_11940 [Scytonema sp. HK-05]BAY48207.1 WD-repeat protein [Scytonema sp. HK-05]
MSYSKSVRKRGVILSATGWDKFQTCKRECEFRENNANRYTYEELSDRTGLSLHTISRVIGRTEAVDKLSLEYCFRAFGLELDKADYTRPSEVKAVDWGEAMDISAFVGRSEELMQLHQWVLIEQCRLVAVLGMGGIGKTAFALKFAKQAQHKYDYVKWLSLSQAPSFDTLVAELVSFLSNQQESTADMGRLMHYLRTSRCLIVFDNLETVLEAGHPGVYRPGYERYGELLRVVGETSHQSCLILTSREKPAEIAAIEGDLFTVRSLKLSGSKEAALTLMRAKGLVGTEAQQQQLCEYYGYNPQAMKIVATSIHDLFDGDIAEFLNQNTIVFNGIRRLLKQQFHRLSKLEQSIMYWLARNQEWTTIAQLRSQIVPTVSAADLLEGLEGLNWRSLIEKQSRCYTLQPMWMEYVSEQLTQHMDTNLTSSWAKAA